MGRRVPMMAAGLVLIGVLCWASAGALEQGLLRWLESAAKERAGLCVSADHAALEFSGAAPAVVLQHVKIAQACGDPTHVDADTVTVSGSPSMLFGAPGVIAAKLVGLRADGDAAAAPSLSLLTTPATPVEARDLALRSATLEIFDPALSEPSPGKMTLAASRATILLDLGAQAGPPSASLRIEHEGAIFNLSLAQARDSRVAWTASLAGSSLASLGGRPVKGHGSVTSRDGATQIRADRIWVDDKGFDVDATAAIGTDRVVTAVFNLPELNLARDDRVSGATFDIADGRPEVRIGSIKKIIWPGVGSWRVDATLTCDTLRMSAVSIGKLRIQMIAQGDELDLRALSEAFYSGRLRARYVQNGQAAKHQLSFSLTGVDVKPLLNDLNGIVGIDGIGSAHLDVQGSGREMEALSASLEGNSDFVVEDGAVDIGRLASGKQRNEALDLALRFAPRFAISKASGRFAIQAGRATTNDLAFAGQNVRGTGAGTIDFNDRRLDLRVVPTIQLKSRGIAVPITFKGSWSSPQISANADALMNADVIGGILDDYGLGGGGLGGGGLGGGRGKIDLFDFFKQGADPSGRR